MKLTTMVSALVAGILCASTAFAGNITIQMTGVDLAYDGAMITSAASPDDLTTVVIDGTTYTSDLDLDLTIPGVTGLGVGSGSSVMSSAGGSLTLGIGTDEVVLNLDPVTVSFIDLGAGVSTFVFAASTAGIDSQSLPGGAELCNPVSVSFSTQVTSMTDDGVNITSFASSGTGELTSVPEPAALVMVLLGMAGLISIRRKK
ncbi:MAG: PEP-CTERM sorting domain-containing protein [Planctomycetota bacterium]